MRSNLLSFLYWGNKSFEVSKYIVEDKNIPKGFHNFKIVHLSDFHSNYFINDKILMQVNEENPNIIIITGDMVNKYDMRGEIDKFLNLAQNLSNKYKTYLIWGNHENRLKDGDKKYLFLKLKKYNICVLDNDNARIYINKEYINIYGINLPNEFYNVKDIKKRSLLKNKIEKLLESLKKNQYNILLVHNPLFFDDYIKYNVNIIFSGHVHGGMIRLPLVGALLSPERKFFPKYNKGIYETKNKFMIVSRGPGHSRPGIRIKNKPEFIIATFKCKE